MKIKDFIYGDFDINEPVLVELLQSKDLARLKGISQFGIPDKYYFKINFDRFEHSVGVMLLLKKLGADTEEQVAGLIHDISQFSFSHISDWVFADGRMGNESYHDTQHEKFVTNTEIPKILEKYMISAETILNDNNFPLLENTLPDICADRIDYSLRELVHNGEGELVEEVLNDIEVENDKVYFKTKKAAILFANAFLNLQTTHWASAEGVTRYSLFSKAFKRAVDSRLIVHDDFWNKSEAELIEILLKSDDLEIFSILEKLEKGQLDDKSGERVYKKFRYVDPFVMTNKGLNRLSNLDFVYRNILEEARRQNAEGILV